MYSVKEIYYTLQGEGAQTGRAAVFLRFAGCNLWSGLERDRAKAVCQFCDTDFVGTDGPGGGKFAGAAALTAAVADCWDQDRALYSSPHPSPPGTGGPFVEAATPYPLSSRRKSAPTFDDHNATAFSVGEGQGEGKNPAKGKPYVVCTGGEPLLQLDIPLIDALHDQGFQVAVETNGTLAAPSGLDWICVSPKARAPLVQTSGHELKLVFPQDGAEPERFEHLDFRYFFLQPMDGPSQKANIEAAARYCLRNPKWRLSLQIHKFIGLP